MKVYLVRHGEAAGNQEGRYIGSSDPPLTERGRMQAECLAEWFFTYCDPTPAVVYSTGFCRSDETADRIAGRLGMKVKVDLRLRELDFGEWEGLCYEQAANISPEQLIRWYEDPLQTSPPGGETLKELIDRVRSCYQHITPTHLDSTVVIVSHGGPIRTLLTLSSGIDNFVERFFDWNCATGSISMIHKVNLRGQRKDNIVFSGFLPGQAKT